MEYTGKSFYQAYLKACFAVAAKELESASLIYTAYINPDKSICVVTSAYSPAKHGIDLSWASGLARVKIKAQAPRHLAESLSEEVVGTIVTKPGSSETRSYQRFSGELDWVTRPCRGDRISAYINCALKIACEVEEWGLPKLPGLYYYPFTDNAWTTNDHEYETDYGQFSPTLNWAFETPSDQVVDMAVERFFEQLSFGLHNYALPLLPPGEDGELIQLLKVF